MTRSSNARLAGFGDLSYIAAGMLNDVLMNRDQRRRDGGEARAHRDHSMELLEAGADLTARDRSRDRCRTV
jgi:hypothetical protein